MFALLADPNSAVLRLYYSIVCFAYYMFAMLSQYFVALLGQTDLALYRKSAKRLHVLYPLSTIFLDVL